MRRVREAERFGAELQLDALRDRELASQRQVHLEVTRTAELVAVGVAQMRVGVNRDQRSRKSARVEVVTAQVTGCASRAIPRRFAADDPELADQIGYLPVAIGIQRAARTDCERQTGEAGDDGR